MSKQKEIQQVLLTQFTSIGMDIPINFDEILSFVVEDVETSADPINWSDGDVITAFRRWIENQSEDA